MKTSKELLADLLNLEGFSGALSLLAEAAIDGADKARAREWAKLVTQIEKAQKMADSLESAE